MFTKTDGPYEMFLFPHAPDIPFKHAALKQRLKAFALDFTIVCLVFITVEFMRFMECSNIPADFSRARGCWHFEEGYYLAKFFGLVPVLFIVIFAASIYVGPNATVGKRIYKICVVRVVGNEWKKCGALRALFRSFLQFSWLIPFYAFVLDGRPLVDEVVLNFFDMTALVMSHYSGEVLSPSIQHHFDALLPTYFYVCMSSIALLTLCCAPYFIFKNKVTFYDWVCGTRVLTGGHVIKNRINKLSTCVDKKFGVFGLGKAGKSTACALVGSGAEVYAWDDAGARIKGLNMLPIDQWPWQKLDSLVLSPGIPLTHPQPHEVVNLAKANNCPIICDIELLYISNPDAKFLAVTGTNGKSTTTALIAHICKSVGMNVAMGGNIGVPVCDLPELGEGGVYVLETSSYQLDLLEETRFNVSVLLNITPDHLDRHGGMAGYIAAKKHIFDNQRKGDVAVIAVDDEYTCAIADELAQADVKVARVSASAEVANTYTCPISIINGVIVDKLNDVKIELGELPYLPGKHNAQNIVAAYAAVRALGVVDSVADAIKTFGGLDHRLQLVGMQNGVAYVNDSKATNDVAAEQALNAYDNIHWIVGGVAKDGGISSLRPLFGKVAHAYLIGKAQDEFADTLDGHVPYTKCETLEKACELAHTSAQKDKTNAPAVLLSPACASFDQYPNFEARGDKFVELVRARGITLR
jgi:UDP-N-acetylmuramoylalanine--D-glutamate ligase